MTMTMILRSSFVIRRILGILDSVRLDCVHQRFRESQHLAYVRPMLHSHVLQDAVHLQSNTLRRNQQTLQVLTSCRIHHVRFYGELNV